MPVDKKIAVISIVITLIIVIGIFTLVQRLNLNEERYAASCRPISVTPSPTISADTKIDENTMNEYKKALDNYNTAASNYNALTDCNDPATTTCVGGTVDSNGNCVCSGDRPVPFIHSDGTVYCLGDVFSSSLNRQFIPDPSRGPNSSFECIPNFSPDKYSGTNNCYNDNDTNNLIATKTLLNTTTSKISNLPNKIVMTYGKVPYKSIFYYITSKVDTTSGLTMMYPTQIPKLNNPADCVAFAGDNGAGSFSWDPANKKCILYTESPPISTRNSPTTKDALIFGSITL